jgi:hypothetical protein
MKGLELKKGCPLTATHVLEAIVARMLSTSASVTANGFPTVGSEGEFSIPLETGNNQ